MMKKTAFTMLEMIFVIVILGIIAGGTFIQISTVYEDMIRKQNSGELETEVKVVADQITARLSSSIKESLVAMTALDGSNCYPVSDKDKLNETQTYILAWIGRSDESNLGLWDDDIGDYRGWSGFVDVSVSDTSTISTKGSRLDYAETVIDDLTGTTGSLSQPANSPVAVYFKEDMTTQQSDTTCRDFGLDTARNPTKLFRVSRDGTDKLNLADTPAQISEQYALTHSAYAIRLENINPTTKTGELRLYSFRPWQGESAASANRYFVLGKHISKFGFRWDGGLFRINVCAKKELNSYPIEVCKEKAIF